MQPIKNINKKNWRPLNDKCDTMIAQDTNDVSNEHFEPNYKNAESFEGNEDGRNRGEEIASEQNEQPNLRREVVVSSLHLSCQSDVMNGRNWRDDVKYAGIIVYSVGNRRNIRVKIRPGYVYVRDTGRMGCEGRDEEQIHGELCRELLGCGAADIMQSGGSLSGFTIFGAEWKFKSYR